MGEILPCLQGTDEWLSEKRHRIGASEIGAIIGVSPWITKRQLWEMKTNRRPPQATNPAMERGLRLEPVARKSVDDVFGLKLAPAVVQDSQQKYLMASLDGWDRENSIIWEHKCPGLAEHNRTPDGPPEKYRYQVQQQLMITGAAKCLFTTLVEKENDYDFKFTWVEPDHEAWALIRKEAADFWDYVMRDKAPPLTEKDWDWLESEDFNHFSKLYAELDAQEDSIKMQKLELREKLISLCPHVKTMGKYIKIQRITAKGRIPYDKIPEVKALGEILEKHRTAPTTSWRLDPKESENDA